MIELQQNDSAGAPTSVTYDATTQELVINGASGQIGEISLEDDGNFSSTSFVIVPDNNSIIGGNYGAYAISLGTRDTGPLYVSSGATQNVDTQMGGNVLDVVGDATVDSGGTLNVESQSTGESGSQLFVGGALTVDSGGLLEISNGASTAANVATVGSLSNSGSITIDGEGAQAELIVDQKS